jgi:phenylacetic acid degradation protein
MVVPERTLVAGTPAKVIRELSEVELAWKIEGTRSYQQLTRRSLETMRETVAMTAVDADRKRIEVDELLPLSTLKQRG